MLTVGAIDLPSRPQTANMAIAGCRRRWDYTPWGERRHMDTRVGIIGKRTNPRAEAVVKRLVSTFTDIDGVEIVIDEATAEAIEVGAAATTAELTQCDLAVSVGGDGTFLYTARTVGTTPILGINLGEVGFLTAVDPKEAIDTVQTAVTRYQEGILSVTSLPRLQATGTNELDVPAAVNEVVIQTRRRGAGSNITIEVSIDGQQYVTEQADGILLATPTGSTAYNLSESGPIVHPAVNGTIVTTMSPATGTRPLVVDETATVTIEVRQGTGDTAGYTTGYVVVDGRNQRHIELPTTVTIERAEQPLRIAGPGVDFFRALEKLS